MEFADIFSAFGSKVSVIEMLPHILPLEDEECAEAVAKAYKRRRIDMHVGAQITGAQIEPGKATPGRILSTIYGDDDSLAAEFLRGISYQLWVVHRCGINRDLAYTEVK